MEKEKNQTKKGAKTLKRILATVVLLIVLLAAAWMYLNRDGSAWRYLNEDGPVEVVTDSEADDIVREHIADLYVNIADSAVMKKGRLLDKAFEKEYNKLPEILYTLKYGDKLYPLFYEEHRDDGENNWFSTIDEHSLEVLNKNLGTMVDVWNEKNMVHYLNLVAKKAVSPPIYDCSGCIYIDIDEFDAYYKDEFSSNGMSQLPLVLKEKIIEFYNSEEGEKIRYVEKGKQTSADLIWSGNLTGNEKTDYAILFKDGKNKLEDYYVLLVFAASNNGYYVVYNEKFYDKVILEHLKTNADGKEYSRKIYMNTPDLVETPLDGIVIKRINQVDRVLVYNNEFDKMVNYHQSPSNATENEEGDSEEGDEQ